jgi:hypothetical protein
VGPRFASSAPAGEKHRLKQRVKPVLQRNIAVLLSWHGVDFVFEHAEGLDEARTGFVGLDDVVDITAFGGDERSGEPIAILGDFRVPVVLAAVDNVDRSLGSHDRDFGTGPGIVNIGAEMLRTHDAVGSSISLTEDHRNLGNSRLSEGVKELRAVTDDASELLRSAGEKAGNIFEGHDRDVEGVAEAHETASFHR